MRNLLLFLLFLPTILRANTENISITLLPNNNWQPLYDSVDTDLQTKLEAKLNSVNQYRRLIQQKKLAVGIVDMQGENPRFARVNGNEMMYAASLPKIAILFAAYASFEDGSLDESAEIHKDLTDMIRISSNAAAARVTDKIGLKKIEQVLSDPTYGFYSESRGGGLWVGKRYASSGTRKGDPIHNISHGATVTQVCRFYYLLSHGKLINAHRSKQMLEDLVDPHIHHKFVSQLDVLAPNATVFRKSGTWKNWHSDSVMVWGQKWRNYILVTMVESADGEKIIRQMLPLAEKLIYQP